MNVKNEIFRRFFPAVTAFVLSLCFSAEAGILHIAPEGGLQLDEHDDAWSLQNDGADEILKLKLSDGGLGQKQAGEVFTQAEADAPLDPGGDGSFTGDSVYRGLWEMRVATPNNFGFLLNAEGFVSRLTEDDTIGGVSPYSLREGGSAGLDLWQLGIQDLTGLTGQQTVRYSEGPVQNFDPGTEGYFGFRFDLDADGDANSEEWQYGWARVTFTGEAPFSFGADGPPPTGMTLHEWAYEDTVGASIQAGAIPEPSTLALVGVIGFAVYLVRYRFAC